MKTQRQLLESLESKLKEQAKWLRSFASECLPAGSVYQTSLNQCAAELQNLAVNQTRRAIALTAAA